MNFANWAGLAGTTFVAALLYVISGFGFALLAAPIYLLITAPSQAIQLVIIVSTALSLTVLPALRRAIAWPLLLRLTIGAVLGLPLGLFAFRHADPLWVRLVVGATILSFALLMAARLHGRDRPRSPLAMSPGRDLSAGAVAGVATALVGMSGPPVLIYLLLAGAAARTVRATLLAFFALSYGATLVAHAGTIGISSPTWVLAGTLIPVAFLGGAAGRPIGDRLGTEAFTVLAIALLTLSGLYTIIAASVSLVTRQP